MWKIDRIELENFRSYRGRHEVVFDRVNLLWGRVGAGKTSLLYAIEYALFGKQLEVREKVAKVVDLINSEAHEMRVALQLSSGSDVLKIERQLNKRGTERLVVTVGGVEYKKREAEETLLQLLEVDEDIYDRLVYISHRTLEGFIYGTSHKRTLSVDRLFGIDVIDNVISRVLTPVMKQLLSHAEDLRSRLANYEKYRDIIRKYDSYEGLVSRLESLSREISELKERESQLSRDLEELAKRRISHIDKIREYEAVLLEYYRVKIELELAGADYVDSDLGKVKNSLKSVVEEFEHFFDPSLLERLNSSDLDTVSIAMVEVYDAIEKLAGDLELQELEMERMYKHYSDKLNKLDSEIADLENVLKKLEKSYSRFRELQKLYPSAAAARLRASELKKRLQEVEREVAFSTSLKTVLTYLAESGSDKCPICGGSLDMEQLSHHLRELGEKFGKVIAEVETLREEVRSVENIAEEMEALQNDVAAYLSARGRVEQLKAERGEVVKKILQAEKALRQLERKKSRLREILERVDKRQISEAVSKYRRALRLRELQRRYRELEIELKKAGISSDVVTVDMQWRSALENLEKVSKRITDLYRELATLENVVREVGGSPESLRKTLENVMYTYEKFQLIKSKLELVKVGARSRLVRATERLFGEIFLDIYRYGDITNVSVDLEQKSGHYQFYAISPTGEKFGISKLSDGQRLSLAVALALALRMMAATKLAFLIFDEPLPYVDREVKSAFVNMVKNLAERYQLFLASQSREFIDMLRESLPAKLFTISKRESSEIS